MPLSETHASASLVSLDRCVVTSCATLAAMPVGSLLLRSIDYSPNDAFRVVKREADLIDIEPQRSLDIAHRQHGNFH
jgi:hypothetical protein